MASWLVGVFLNLAGSILINLGTNVMKLAHNKRAALPLPERDRPPARRFKEWRLGVAAFAFGNVANFISFGYAAQSLLAAIGCVQFVSNVAFASAVLKERVSRAVLAATACIVAGCMLLVSFGDHSSVVYTARDLLGLYAEPAYITYLCLGSVMVVACYMLYHIGCRSVVQRGAAASRGWAAALPVLYSAFSALVGTQSVLFSKTLAVLVRATFGGDNQFKSWFIYLVIPCFALSAVFWITRLNKGLMMFPALVIVPTLQIAWTLFSILSGMLYFKEYRDLTPLAAAMFALGLLVMFVGVLLLTRFGSPPVPQAAAGTPRAAKLTVLQDPGVGADKLESPCGDGGRIGVGRATEEELLACHDVSAGSSFSGGGANAGTDGTARSAAHPAAACAAAAAAGVAEAARPPRAPPAGGGGPCSGAAGQGEGDEERLLACAPSSSGPGMPEDTSTRKLRRVVTSFGRRMRADFNLDEATAARLMLGLGDGALPAMSLFGPPVLDLSAAAAQRKQPGRGRRRRSLSRRSGSRKPGSDRPPGPGVGGSASAGGGGGKEGAGTLTGTGQGTGGSAFAVQGSQHAAVAAAAGRGGGCTDDGPAAPWLHDVRRLGGGGGGGIDPLANAISIPASGSPAARRPGLPLTSVVSSAEATARSIRTALSAELRVAAGALRGGGAAATAGLGRVVGPRAHGYTRADVQLAEGGGSDEENALGTLGQGAGDGGGGVAGHVGVPAASRHLLAEAASAADQLLAGTSWDGHQEGHAPNSSQRSALL